MADRLSDDERRNDRPLVAIDDMPIPACLCDAAGEIVWANRLWRSALSQPGISATAPVTTDAVPNLRAHLREALARGVPTDFEVTLHDADGRESVFLGRCAPVANTDEPRAVSMCALLDVSGMRRREAQLSFMATHDPLTGLPNRRMFEDALVRAVARARRGKPGALLMLDIDNLKSYNDTLGHPQGDQALVNVALLLQTHVRSGDMLARVGGDEFGVIFEATSLGEAAEIAERMRRAASEESFVADAREFELGLSGGVILFDGDEEVHVLMDAADAALYEAKEDGRNRLVVRDAGATPTRGADARSAARIRRALAARRFRVHYQPVVRLADGETVYFESLVRMISDSGDLEMPSSFLPATGRLGLMPRLTRLVVDEVLEALATVAAARVSVNLSGSDLLDRELPAYIERGLADAAVQPSRLAFEVAEADAVAYRDALPAWLERFGSEGCSLVLDHFSAGERGLRLVRELPFDQVKIDVTTLVGLTEGPGDPGYLEAVRRVVESHGLDAVASRIEDPEVMERVRAAGFGFAQGYDIGRPRMSPS